jgi:hypothetical protein
LRSSDIYNNDSGDRAEILALAAERKVSHFPAAVAPLPHPVSCSGHFGVTKYLGGPDVGFAISGQGVFVGPRLSSDQET